MLNIVYLGGDESLAAAESLSVASDSLIDGTDVSYKRVHEAIHKSTESTQTLDTAAEAPNQDSSTEPSQDSHELQGSNFITLSEASKMATGVSSGGISFLNESEIEGTHQSESLAEPALDEAAPAPTQTLTEVDEHKAAPGEVDWSTNAPRSNWADDESSEAPAPEPESTSAPSDIAPSKGAIQQPNLHSIDEFKTVEKKAPVRDGRGRVSIHLVCLKPS